MNFPQTTRLRFFRSKNILDLVSFTNKINVRIQVLGAPVWDGVAWTLWFIPSDNGLDIACIDLVKAASTK